MRLSSEWSALEAGQGLILQQGLKKMVGDGRGSSSFDMMVIVLASLASESLQRTKFRVIQDRWVIG
jgi:hypothetical protein